MTELQKAQARLTISDFRGTKVWFKDLTSPSAAWDALTPRQLRLVTGAANFHALQNAGRRVELRVHQAPAGSHLFLTDESTERDEEVDGHPVLAVLSVQLDSDSESASPAEADGPVTRYIRVSADADATGAHAPRPLSPYWWLRSKAEQRAPVLYDSVRHTLLARRERRRSEYPIGRRNRPFFTGHEGARRGGQPIALIGMHWFEMGGAERWAFRTVELAQQAGLVPVVITDKASQHEWITRPELDGAVVVPLTHTMEPDDQGEPFLAPFLARADLRGVFIHHCHWLYDRLTAVRAVHRDIPVIDSLHIVEDGGGGYPAIAVHLEDYIDFHHVISPMLVEWLSGYQRVDPKKVILAPLHGLSVSESAESVFHRREPTEKFVIAFVGRLVRQKRPYLFIGLLRELQRRRPGSFRVIMHGDGDLSPLVTRQLRRYGLAELVERRTHSAPVGDSLDQAHCLVLSSLNEGITLTSFEAIAHGIPVLSTDVGSQRTVVVDELLVPRSSREFVKGAADEIARLIDDDDRRERLWNAELERARAISLNQSADDFAREEFAKWSA